MLEEDYHASVLAIDDHNSTLMLINRSCRDGRIPLWKFPGGGGEVGETPAETAAREYFEETGITIESDQLELITKITILGDGMRMRKTHIKYCFFARIPSLKGHLEKSDDGEVVGRFSIFELEKMVDINHVYHRFYQEAKKAGFITP